MDIRYGASPQDAKTYDTAGLRREFLIEEVFRPGEMTATYSHVDRMLVLGIVPTQLPIDLEAGIDPWKDLGVEYALERREIGIFNLGGPGRVRAGDAEYPMGRLDALYLGMGTRGVAFHADDPADPPRFYACSAPAHRPCPPRLLTRQSAKAVPMGDAASANLRTIYQFIHPDVLDTCQLSMGVTVLEPGSVWNTMPAHTHERRMEVYLYFGMEPGNAVFHMMGEPAEVRTILMHNDQAVISPSWSIHSGCGTAAYTFLWAMAGENRVFTDMDAIEVQNMT